MGLMDIVKRYAPRVEVSNEIARRDSNVEKYSRGLAAEVDQLPGYVMSAGKEQPTLRGTLLDYVDSYSTSVWVFVCVNRISCSESQVPLKVWERDPGSARETWKEVTDPKDSMVKLFTRPNFIMSQGDFIEAIGAALELVGNAYAEVVRDEETDIPVELYPLLPYRVKIIPDPEAYIGGYLYDVPKGKFKPILFDKDEVIHFKLNNPKDDFYGHPPMRTAENSVIVDLYATAYNKNFFKNAAVPEGVLLTEQSLDEGVLRRTRRAWNLWHKGVDRAHTVAILEQGLKYQSTASTMKDMQFIQLRERTRDEIFAIYGVPAILATIASKSNFSNAIEQWQQYWIETICPKLKKIEERINFDLVPMFKNPNRYVEFDRETIVAMRENKDSEARIHSTYVDRGILTINDVRIKMGLPKVEWGDEWWMNGNLINVAQAKSNAGQPPGSLQGVKIKPGPDGAHYANAPQPTKFPSQLGKMDFVPASYILKQIKQAESEVSELSPFRQAKLKVSRRS